MKIGVALSGCDVGGLGAYAVLERLEEKGYEIPLISSCCMPSVTALMHALGLERDKIHELAGAFLACAGEKGVAAAAEETAALLPAEKLKENKTLAISSVNIPDGKIITFTNAYSIDTEMLRTFPLDSAFDALSSTISLMDSVESYHHGDCRLCDYSVWYGCPLYPLKMNGILKTVSVSFLPAFPKTPYEALARQIILQSSRKADVHVQIEFASGIRNVEDYIETARKQIDKSINKIYWRTLF